jgi:threonyl-tRNA synthetase
VETKTVSVRARSGEDLGSVAISDLSKLLADSVAKRSRANSEN